ncbi:neuferricin isoform X2 [Petaurus breviceps papuanus]|uniref:neuferricin isoform X2 n=1 Tax=Petaurus breviceps papuanus TaxID=3040969 RepID=UPI0036D7F3FC
MERKRRNTGGGAGPRPGLALTVAVAVAGAAAAAAAAAWLLGGPEAAARPRLLRASELARYRGATGEPGLYLALLGRVFDVGAGQAHYARGRAYGGLAGRDASRAFVTGDFSEKGLNDDVSDFSPSQMLILRDWLLFYEKNYVFVGQSLAYKRGGGMVKGQENLNLGQLQEFPPKAVRASSEVERHEEGCKNEHTGEETRRKELFWGQVTVQRKQPKYSYEGKGS